MPESQVNAAPASRKSWLWVAVLGMMIVPGIVSLLYLRSAPRKPLDTLAVLPFAHSPDEPRLASLSSQITSGLIRELGRNARLTVTPYETVASYLGDTRSAQELGHELGVRAILRGRIERRNGGFLVSAELADAGDNAVLWSRQFAISGEDELSALQAELATHLDSFLRSR
jgi:TolB-like protein